MMSIIELLESFLTKERAIEHLGRTRGEGSQRKGDFPKFQKQRIPNI